MLNRAKLLHALEVIKQELFAGQPIEYKELEKLWHLFVQDECAQQILRLTCKQEHAPCWQESISTVYPIDNIPASYQVLAVDGSQIYPDKHMGTMCYLINIGLAYVHYQQPQSLVRFDTQPFIFTESQFDNSTDYVNALRQYFELSFSLEKSMIMKDIQSPHILLFDGALIFWHLQSKEEEFKQFFLKQYVEMLQQFFNENIILAGYISFPKSKDLVMILEGYQKYKNISFDIKNVQDTIIASFLLEPMQRTIVFENNAPIALEYPQHLKPYFFYIHTGYEIARVEIPGWIAQDQQVVNFIAYVLQDQIKKGRGYPICLAEAHEQAVVKGIDRDFFYHMIKKMGIDQQKRIIISPKNQKKKYIGC